MSGELVRLGAQQNKLAKRSGARQQMDAALARLRGGEVAPTPPAPLPSSRFSSYRPPRSNVIDLPRYCAVHDRPYISRYVLDGSGHYRYGQSIRFVEGLEEQYQDETALQLVFPNDDFQIEACPWCGASGFGAVQCGDCKDFICYGRTTAKGHFTCRSSCGSEGKLAHREYEVSGFEPAMSSSRRTWYG